MSAAGEDGRMNHAEHKAGTTVISAIGEYCGRVFCPKEDFTAIKNTITVTANEEEISPQYLYFLLARNAIPRRGSSQPFLSKGDTQKYGVVVPDRYLLKIFDDLVHPLFSKIQNNLFQERLLSRLRDTLLPRLVGGEIALSSIST